SHAMATATKLTMSPQEDPGTAKTTPAGHRREDVIRAAVLKALGRPARLLRVAVMPLWDDNYRVNVVTGDAAAARIPNSYFVTADALGKILGSVPPILRQY